MARGGWAGLQHGDGSHQNDRGQAHYAIASEARRGLVRKLLELDSVPVTETAR